MEAFSDIFSFFFFVANDGGNWLQTNQTGTEWLQANLFLVKGFWALAVNSNGSSELPFPLTWDQVVCPWMILFSIFCKITFLSLICLICFLIIYIFEGNLLYLKSLIFLCSSHLPVFSAVQHHLTLYDFLENTNFFHLGKNPRFCYIQLHSAVSLFKVKSPVVLYSHL